MQAKGLIHVHSNFSDGELSLEEIKKESQKLGVSFVLIADHLTQVEASQGIDRMIEKCRQLSDKNFLIIPGFEVEPRHGYHFLIYNWNSENQFLILAHASQYSKKPPEELLEKLDGIEVWNAKYDSRYAPNLKALSWLKGKNLVAMVGLDAHSSAGLRKMWIELEIEKLDIKEILDTLKEKKFRVNNGSKVVDINQPLVFSQEILFRAINYLYAPIRIPFIFFAKLGIEFPPFFKKIFHKFF